MRKKNYDENIRMYNDVRKMIIFDGSRDFTIHDVNIRNSET